MSSNERVSSPGKRQAGYFCHMRLNEKHTGAILVTNEIGVPLEFKYTEPVAVTKLHRILYGSSLERYLHETVIRDRLGHELRSQPEFFLAPYDEKEYLGAIGGKEMMAIQRLQLGQTESTGQFTRVRDREAIIELDEGIDVRVAFSTPDGAAQQYMVAWIQELGRTMDVLEPFERLSAALRNVCGDEKKA
jgi:hypothetical protein